MINAKDIYDKANSIVGMSQKDFVTAFNEAVLQLQSRYEERYIFDKGVPSELTVVDETIPIYSEWSSSILNYVIYLKNGDQLRKTEYDTSLDYAYRTIWKKRLGHGKRFKSARWI